MRHLFLTLLFTLVASLGIDWPVSAQESPKQQGAKTDLKPEPKLPAIAIISAEESKLIKDLGKDAENADLRAQLLAERIRTAQAELEKLQQAAKDLAERVKQVMRAAAQKAGVPADKMDQYDLSEEKGQFVLKLKGPPPKQ